MRIQNFQLPTRGTSPGFEGAERWQLLLTPRSLVACPCAMLTVNSSDATP